MNQQDKRFARDPRDRAPRAEVGTDTVPVNLVELQSVARKKRGGGGSMVVLAVALVALGVFAGMVLTGRPFEPEPSPTPPVAVASPSLAATAPVVVLPTASPVRTTRPSPTPAPPGEPWEWVRTDLPGDGLRAAGIWAVDGAFMVLGEQVTAFGSRTGWVLARLEPGQVWRLQGAPPAIDGFYGGTVIDDRLWFLARVVGVTPDDVSWQLVSTSDSHEWESLGESQGLESVGDPEFLARIGDTWVTAAMEFGEGPCCTGGDPATRIFWSGDGVSWAGAELPELPGEIMFGSTRAGVVGDTMIVAGLMASGQDQVPFVLRSSNGRTWRLANVPFATPNPRLITGLACDGLVCVITTARPLCNCEPKDDARAYVSPDGREWRSNSLPIPDSAVPDDGLRNLISTGAGFLAVAGESGNALLSRNGEEWGAVAVMPLALSRHLVGIAVSGDIVLGVAETFNDRPNGIWEGSLTLMDPCVDGSCPSN